MKIIQLISGFQLGGAEKVALDISTKLKNNVYDIEFISIFKSDSEFSYAFKSNLNNNGIKWKEIALTKQSSKFKYISLIYTSIILFFYLIKNKINIIHSHTDLPDFVLSNVVKLNHLINYNKLLIIRTIHNTTLWPTHFKIGKYVEKSFENDSVIFISNDVKEAYKRLRTKYSLKESKNQYFISNGVDLEKYNNTLDSDVLKTLNIFLNPKKINLLFVGRFVEQKGFDLIINLFKELETKYSDKFQIYAFGSGKLDKLVDDSIPINLYKPINNINEIYKYFDYLIMPSRFEGLPLVSLEASASKLPVIASYSPGLKETLPEDWILFFKNESLEELKNLLIEISDNKFDRTSLCEKSFEFVEKNFNLEKTITLYKKIYTNLGKK